MTVLQLVLLVLGLIFLALATIGISDHPRVRWGWLGLFCWLLAEALPHLAALR